MSIASILAFVLAGAAAKVKSVQVARRSEDAVGHAVMKDMARELRAANARTVELEGERDRQYEANVGLIARIAELESDIAVANANARRDQDLLDIWRVRALANVPPPGFGAPPPQIALQQAALQQMQQNQLAAYQGLGNSQYGSAMLGAQRLTELFCNCVPARHDMFLRGE